MTLPTKLPATAGVLAVGGLTVFAYLVVVLTLVPIPTANKELLFAVIGIVGGVLVGGPFGYYFGTSAGSDRKTDALADQASTARTLAEAGAADPAAGVIEGAVTIDGGAKA